MKYTNNYFIGEYFEQMCIDHMKKNYSYFVHNFPVNQKKKFLKYTAGINKRVGDLYIQTENIPVLADCKCHGWVSFSSASSNGIIPEAFYILSESNIGGPKDPFDITKIWVIPTILIKNTMHQIYESNKNTLDGFDYLPSYQYMKEGEWEGNYRGILVNLNGEMKGAICSQGRQGLKMRFDHWLDNGCIFDLSIYRKKAAEELKEREEKKRDYSKFKDL